MDLSLHAAIHCTDGSGGHAVAILLNPVSDQITHVVVREPGMMGGERMVPVEFVTESTAEQTRLSCTVDRLAELPPFVSTHYIAASPDMLPDYGMGVAFWPYVAMQPGTSIDQENTDWNELVLHRGAQVNATDGQVGEVEEFVVDQAQNRITHLVLREGHFWNHRDVTIPVAQIDYITDDNVYLTLDTQQIGALPVLTVDRRTRATTNRTLSEVVETNRVR